MTDRLDDALRAVSPPVHERAPAITALTRTLSDAAEHAVRPRPRRSSRIAIGVIAGVFVLGGVSTAAAFTANRPPWALSPDRVFEVADSHGVQCELRVSAQPADATIDENNPQVVAARQILRDIDLASLDVEVEPSPPPVPNPLLSATTRAISEAVWNGLYARDLLEPEDPADVSVASEVRCGDGS
jgi:hypothetical protein